MARDKHVVLMPLGCRANCNCRDRNTAEHVQQRVPVDGGDEEAFAGHNPKHTHSRSHVKGSDRVRNVQNRKQPVPSTHIPHDNTAVDGTRHHDSMETADANARDHTDVAEHALLEGERAGAVGALDMLPNRYAAVHGARYEMGSVVRDGTRGYGARVHVLKQVGQLVDAQMARRDDCRVKTQPAIRLFPRYVPAKTNKQLGKCELRTIVADVFVYALRVRRRHKELEATNANDVSLAHLHA